MKYLKLFEEYSSINSGYINHFSKEIYNEIVQYLKSKEIHITKVLGYGNNGIAYELNDGKVLKYTEEVSEVEACDILSKQPNEYFYDVYDLSYYFKDDNDEWLATLILCEKLEILDETTLNSLEKLSDMNNTDEKNGLFDKMLENGYSKDFYGMLSDDCKLIYDMLFNLKDESDKKGICLYDCRIDNLGLKNGHIAMFDVMSFSY